MGALIDHGTKLVTAGGLYAQSTSKPHFNALNKAEVNFSKIVIPMEANRQLNELQSSVMAATSESREAYTNEVRLRCTAAQETLNAQTVDLAKWSKGAPNGGSWKDGLEQCDLEAVLDRAFSNGGLLSGPGAKVLGCKDILEKASVII